jgi:hypothetical protein
MRRAVCIAVQAAVIGCAAANDIVASVACALVVDQQRALFDKVVKGIPE